MSEQTRFRCAIYTRKSSEDGLDQDFNSIEAQREAGEAYVRSQAHEGWAVVSDRFDDGGFSGGNMDRPALKRLMEAVAAGKVDVVVIYKIDRLTRSLTDFARLAETFDKHNVSFVSVTQQFNTTNSMGRLMLNVLLSFAQFEREITGERIRDKIAASKKKGMWMGGPVPMGYLVKDRRLVINEVEAAAVRKIFSLYLEVGDVPALLNRMEAEDIVTPLRQSRGGRSSGSKSFTRGHIYKLLSNPLYIGRVRHRSASHPGQHEPIIDLATWRSVQTQLTLNTQGSRRRRRRAETVEHLLADQLFSASGHRFIPTHAVKGARRYRYYVEDVSPEAKPRRLPAKEIELAVVAALQVYFGDKAQLSRDLGVSSPALGPMLEAAAVVAGQLKQSGKATRTAVDQLLSKVVFRETQIELRLFRFEILKCLGWRDEAQRTPLSNAHPADDHIVFCFPLLIRHRGKQLKLIVGGEETNNAKPDPSLITAVVRAHDWASRILAGESSTQIAREDGVTDGYVSQLLPLAFLAPSIVTGSLEGRQTPSMTADHLIWRTKIPSDWREQHAMLGVEP